MDGREHSASHSCKNRKPSRLTRKRRTRRVRTLATCPTGPGMPSDLAAESEPCGIQVGYSWVARAFARRVTGHAKTKTCRATVEFRHHLRQPCMQRLRTCRAPSTAPILIERRGKVGHTRTLFSYSGFTSTSTPSSCRPWSRPFGERSRHDPLPATQHGNGVAQFLDVGEHHAYTSQHSLFSFRRLNFAQRFAAPVAGRRGSNPSVGQSDIAVPLVDSA